MSPPRSASRSQPLGGRLLLGLACLAPWLGSPARAQEASAPRIEYARDRKFRIPFTVDPANRVVRYLNLFVYDSGKNRWMPAGTARPEDRQFIYDAGGDGWYWFTVQTVDADNRANPDNLARAQVMMKICVDTLRPAVTVRPLQATEGGVGIEWQVRDDNLDPASLVVEFRAAGGVWQPLAVQPAVTGERTWNPGTSVPLEVRVLVRDKAGNVGEGTTTVQAGGGAGRNAPPEANPGRDPNAGNAGGVKVVNSRKLTLNWEIREQGKSKVDHVDLWLYEDASRRWAKYDKPLGNQPPFNVELEREGLWGLTLIAVSGVGKADPPPKAGDLPQVWVEVDETKPVVSFDKIEVGQGLDAGLLSIGWKASDNKQLARLPISLFYADKAEGPWTEVVRGLENRGLYAWRMPEGLPFKFFLKIEAVDRAGNVGVAFTAEEVKVDLVVPKVRVLDINVGGSAASPDRP
jgi:hypothetical protein